MIVLAEADFGGGDTTILVITTVIIDLRGLWAVGGDVFIELVLYLHILVLLERRSVSL